MVSLPPNVTPPNPKPQPRTRVVSPGSDGYAPMSPVQRQRFKPKAQKFYADAWKFNPDNMATSLHHIFMCEGCNGGKATAVQIPYRLFMESINSDDSLQLIKKGFVDKVRKLIKNSNSKYFNENEAVKAADKLTAARKLPYNPFRAGANNIKVTQANLLDQYKVEYRKFLTQPPIVSVQGSPVGQQPEEEKEAPTVAASKVSVKSAGQTSPVEQPSVAVVELPVRKTMDAVGVDKDLAKRYLEYETKVRKEGPRKSLVNLLQKVIDKR